MGYALGQILCTQFWKQQYRPRNYIPWGITIGSYVGDWIILITLRVYLQRENARRDRLLLAGSTATSGVGEESGVDEKRDQRHEQHLQESYGYVERIGPDGVLIRQKVEKAFLDLTVRSSFNSECSLKALLGSVSLCIWCLTDCPCSKSIRMTGSFRPSPAATLGNSPHPSAPNSWLSFTLFRIAKTWLSDTSFESLRLRRFQHNIYNPILMLIITTSTLLISIHSLVLRTSSNEAFGREKSVVTLSLCCRPNEAFSLFDFLFFVSGRRCCVPQPCSSLALQKRRILIAASSPGL